MPLFPMRVLPEYQILDNFSNHVDTTLGKDGNRRAGTLYDLIPADPQNAKGAMEWNSVEILVYNGTVVHFMNGEKVTEYHLWTDEWNEMVANSKLYECGRLRGISLSNSYAVCAGYKPGYLPAGRLVYHIAF